MAGHPSCPPERLTCPPARWGNMTAPIRRHIYADPVEAVDPARAAMMRTLEDDPAVGVPCHRYRPATTRR